jgi:hypothetical protein
MLIVSISSLPATNSISRFNKLRKKSGWKGKTSLYAFVLFPHLLVIYHTAILQEWNFSIFLAKSNGLALVLLTFYIADRTSFKYRAFCSNKNELIYEKLKTESGYKQNSLCWWEIVKNWDRSKGKLLGHL